MGSRINETAAIMVFFLIVGAPSIFGALLPVYYEGFGRPDSNSLGANWSETETLATNLRITHEKMNLTDNNANQLYATWSGITEGRYQKFSMHFKHWNASIVGGLMGVNIKNNNNFIIQAGCRDGQFLAYDGVNHFNGTCRNGAWYLFEFDIDFKNALWTFYVNGSQILKNRSFADGAAPTMDEVTLLGNKNLLRFRAEWDNITLWNESPDNVYIHLERVNTSLNDTPLLNQTNISFARSLYNFSYNVTADQGVNHTISEMRCQNGTNKSLSRVKITNTTSPEISFVINWTDIVDFFTGKNHINCTLNISSFSTVNGSDNALINIRITDSAFPSCSFVNFANIQEGDNYPFNVSCSDENFYSFNFSCSNGYSYIRENINETTFNFSQTVNFNSSAVCNMTYCDGHTSRVIKDFKIKKNSGERKFEIFENTLEYSDGIDLNLDKKKDRYEFGISRTEGKKDDFEFIYTTVRGVYREDERFPGWIIDGSTSTWLDLAGDVEKVTVKEISPHVFSLKVKTDKDSVTFHSIGALNCIDANITINASAPPTVPNATAGDGLSGTVGFLNVSDALYFFFIYALWITLLVLTFSLRGKNGQTVQLFNIFQVFVAVYASGIMLPISLIVGIPTAFVGVGVFVGKIITG